jgi:hypothetical protein
MRVSSWLSRFGAFILVFAPATLSAQGAYCTNLMSDGCDSGEHWAPLIPSGAKEYPHDSCESNFGEFPKHYTPCNPAQDNPVLADAYRAAQDAAESGDSQELVALIPRLGPWISVNEKRGALQLLSCDRSAVVASLSLSPAIITESVRLLRTAAERFD